MAGTELAERAQNAVELKLGASSSP